MQGYNAQAAVTPEQIVIAAEIDRVGNLPPTSSRWSTRPARSARSAGVSAKPSVILADAGYWKNDAIEAIVSQGIQTLIAPDADSRKELRPGRRGGLYDFTRQCSRPTGAGLYANDKARSSPSSRTDQVKPRREPVPTPRRIGGRSDSGS